MSFDVMTLIAKITADTSEFDSAIGGVESKAKGLGGSIASGLGTAAKVGAGALVAATGAATTFAKSAVSAGQNFDSSMSKVAATMGTSVDEIEDLRKFAQQMGATTAFSATEAADALNYMALAGYKADVSMKMLPNVLNLAAAGGMSLANASDMVTDAQSALGLTIEETEAMVDQMAKASSKTNTSVAQLGDAILTIGATARNVKGGTVELSQALGVLADNGIKGSEGGTHLRNMLLALQSPTDKGKEAFEALGMSYKDVFDEAGNLRSLPEIFQDIQKAMDGLSDAEKTPILTKLFNKTDLAAANALIGTSAERWAELEASISDASGAANAMADTQLDNLSGAITLFRSALEGAQIAVSDKLTPTITDFVKLATDGLSDVTLAFQDGGLDSAMDAFGGFISNGLNLIVEKLPMLVDAGARVLNAVINGISQNIPQIATAASSIISSFASSLMTNIPIIVRAGGEAIAEFAKGLSSTLPELIPVAVEAILELTQALIDNLPILSEGAVQLAIGIAEGLILGIPKIIAKIPDIIASIVKAFFGFDDEMVKTGANLIIGIGKGMLDGVVNVINTAKKVASNILGAVKGFFGISSPSKVMRVEVGRQLGEGVVLGLQDEHKAIQDAAQEIASIATGEPETAINTYTPKTDAGIAVNSNARIESLLITIIESIQSMGVTLDGETLVGYMAPKIDKELGAISSNRSREVAFI